MIDITVKIYADAKRAWRWRATTANGRIVADSGQGYTRKADAERAVNMVIQNFRSRVTVTAPDAAGVQRKCAVWEQNDWWPKWPK